jgi:RHS repeat-associated protein
MDGTLAAVNLPTAVSGNTFNADNGMTGFNGTTLSYDANGNLTSDGTNTYTWNARNQLSAISGGASASFVYGAFGRRVSKTINGVTTQFLYDGLNPVQELNGANPPSVTANLLTGLNIDQYFARTDSSGTMAFLRDALGSTIGLVNSAGGIDTSYTYEPFGNTTISGPSANAFQFTGRENDATGLYFYRARYYSPLFQRFVSQDPLGFAGGDVNLYAYAHNDPINLTDPFGTCSGGTPSSLPSPDPEPQPTPNGTPPPSPCSSLAGAAYITGITAASIYGGARLGAYYGGWIGIWVGEPEAGWALGILGGELYGAYQAYALIQMFCGW